MNKFLKDSMTCADGESYDLGRISWIISMAVVIGNGVWAGIEGHLPDITTTAQALGLVAAAHGAALWAKRTTEPGHV